MDRGTFVADLFGGKADTLTLKRPVEAILATLRTPTTASCPGIEVSAPRPIAALCGALTALGQADCAMQVRDPGGRHVTFVASIRDVALGDWEPVGSEVDQAEEMPNAE